MRNRLALLLLAVAALTATAQPTLDDCRRAAREHYPLVRQYELTEAAQGFALERLSRALLPQVGLTVQGTLQSAVPEFPDRMKPLFEAQGIHLEGLHREQFRAQIDVAQTVWDGGRTRARRRETLAATQAAHRQTDADLYALYSRVDELYFGLLLYGLLTETPVFATTKNTLVDKIRTELASAAGQVRTYFVGSMFGGTGASLLPNVARTLHEDPKIGQNANYQQAACLMLPYFKFQTPNDKAAAPVNFATFDEKTATALEFYSKDPTLVSTDYKPRNNASHSPAVFDEMYLFGRKASVVYTVIALVFIFLGTVTSSDLVWGLSDMFNQLMVIPNVIALFALTKMVVSAVRGGELRK